MSGASPPGGEPGYEIELGAVEVADLPTPAEAAPEERHRFDRFTRHANAAMAIGAVILLAAAAVLGIAKWAPWDRPVAETTVLAFLEAVHDKDIAGALALTDVEDPDGDFLVPEALDSRWSIVKVAQVDYTENKYEPGRVVAKVYAEIEAYDGTRIGHRYSVGVVDGKAVIENGLTVSEDYSVFDRLTLNGVTVDASPDGAVGYFMLLPGVYTLYPDLPSILEFSEPNVSIALGNEFQVLGTDWASSTGLPISYPEFSAEGLALLDATLAEHFDACAAEPATVGCAFGFPEDPDRDVAMAPGAAWEVTTYPQVTTVWIWFEEIEGANVLTVVPGEARADVIITEDGREREVTVACPIRTDGLYVEIDLEGGMAISEEGTPNEDRCRSLIEVD